MTTKARVALEIAQYFAMGAGILVATSGQFKLLAATIPLALLGLFWVVAILRARRSRSPSPEEQP